MTWHQDAACRGLPARWWYPENGEGANHAKAVCAECPVRSECFIEATMNNELDGIWGGISFNRSTRARRRRFMRLSEPADGVQRGRHTIVPGTADNSPGTDTAQGAM